MTLTLPLSPPSHVSYPLPPSSSLPLASPSACWDSVPVAGCGGILTSFIAPRPRTTTVKSEEEEEEEGKEGRRTEGLYFGSRLITSRPPPHDDDDDGDGGDNDDDRGKGAKRRWEALHPSRLRSYEVDDGGGVGGGDGGGGVDGGVDGGGGGGGGGG